MVQGSGLESKAYYYQLDHLGTPQELTDSQGKIVWSAHYRAYGQLAIAKVEEVINPIRFQGQYHDLETGLHYNRHRYYDPYSARFTTIDPIGLAGGLNNYQYVPNPTGWVDPLGLASCKGDCPEVKELRGTVNGSYSAVNPGPLSDAMAETFSGGRYKAVTLEEDIVMHRAGTADKPLGQFFSLDPPTSEIQSRIDKAVLPVWPGGAVSPIDSSFDVKIPAGTEVYVGEVGSQGGAYVGGTEQIIVLKPWLLEGVEVVGSRSLK
ncbi:RHS repeat domain-containing protein [Neptuniibacter sp. PT34_22]|uniref:RHS repeat domain-containing protein n=1 Tax=Neptuniibacter sp. PT34_22 TaxID=3398205 RepID=UPI0039F5BC72